MYMMSGMAMRFRTSPLRAAISLPAYRFISTCCAVLCIGAPFFVHAVAVQGQIKAPQSCPRPQTNSVVDEPADVRSKDGVLDARLIAYDAPQSDGAIRYCMVDGQGHQSPNLRVHPGDLVILHLKNAMTGHDNEGATHAHSHAANTSQGCSAAPMTAFSTNLHFHGLTIPATCHADDVLKTSLAPGAPEFEYRFHIPADEPPGLYWYHPHIHGFSKQQLLGGASGALIVEGIERAKKEVAGLPERVLVIRDQDLIHPNSPPSKSEPVIPKFMIDKDGDSANNGTGFGKPAKDLSINYVPVPYPEYPPATIRVKPGEKQLWRVLNASAITYLNLSVLFHRVAQPLGVVAMDGTPIGYGLDAQNAGDSVIWQTHLGIPPGARAEFIVETPHEDVDDALFVTRTVDTGPGGENDTNRALAKIVPSADAPELQSRLEATPLPLPPPDKTWLGFVKPVRVRHLYFSEKLTDLNDPTSAVEFYLTEEGQTPKVFDMNATEPNMVAEQGTVEDWVIENRSRELHAFHIHQLHFLLLEYMGRPVNENFLRDTVNVPYFDGRLLSYPTIRVRVDFRDPNTVGTFPYHCHLLEHEDKGMMGTIRVDPASMFEKKTRNDTAIQPNSSR